MTQLSFVFLGLSITSSWGNGHATTYRALLRELARRGHSVRFLERDLPYYAENRDLPNPPYARTELYESVAEQITKLIDRGTLRPGERIPSVRKLSRQRGVSISTILQAYRVLENRGLIEARPQSGYFVRVKPWTPPAEPEISRPAKRATPSTADCTLADGELARVAPTSRARSASARRLTDALIRQALVERGPECLRSPLPGRARRSRLEMPPSPYP